MSPLFDKYTDGAKRVLMLAQEEARRLNHNYIGTEHLLLGLVREGEGIAAKTLGVRGVDLTKVRSAVEFIVGRGERIEAGDIALTPRAKKVIELTAAEVRRVRHSYIGTEHILLGIVQQGDGVAIGVLESLGVDLAELRSALEITGGQEAPGREEGPARPEERAEESEVRLTPRAIKALEFAAEEARRFDHSQIGTGHLLIGLVREGEGIGARILQGLGVNLQRLRKQVRQAVSQGESL